MVNDAMMIQHAEKESLTLVMQIMKCVVALVFHYRLLSGEAKSSRIINPAEKPDNQKPDCSFSIVAVISG